MTANDAKGTEIKPGDHCTYRPDLDSMEQTFGVVDEDYNGDPCTITRVTGATVAFIRFEGDPSQYRVHTGALLLTKPATAPAPKPAPPTPKTDEKEEE